MSSTWNLNLKFLWILSPDNLLLLCFHRRDSLEHILFCGNQEIDLNFLLKDLNMEEAEAKKSAIFHLTLNLSDSDPWDI